MITYTWLLDYPDPDGRHPSRYNHTQSCLTSVIRQELLHLTSWVEPVHYCINIVLTSNSTFSFFTVPVRCPNLCLILPFPPSLILNWTHHIVVFLLSFFIPTYFLFYLKKKTSIFSSLPQFAELSEIVLGEKSFDSAWEFRIVITTRCCRITTVLFYFFSPKYLTLTRNQDWQTRTPERAIFFECWSLLVFRWLKAPSDSSGLRKKRS